MVADKNKEKKQKEIEYIKEENEERGDSMKKIKRLKEKLKLCQKEKNEYLEGWQRAKADLINFKKEQERRMADYYKFANENLILEILPVLDSFEEALKHSKDEGLFQIYNQLKSILKTNGLEEIKALGEQFNPEFHEAVGEVKSNKKEGTIIEETQKGYKLHGKVIRPSRVKVAK